MRSTLSATLVAIVFAGLLFTSKAGARVVTCDYSKADFPKLTAAAEREYVFAVHTLGNMVLSVTNYGVWGEGYVWGLDYFTLDDYEFGSEYPKGSKIHNLRYGTFWVGGILDGDTLVSTGTIPDWTSNLGGYEFHPNPLPEIGFETRSIGNPESAGCEDAVSEQDIIAVYNDTVDRGATMWDSLGEGLHLPLYVEVTQKSYVWSNTAAEDFVLFDIAIRNFGDKTIENAYFGVLTRPMVGYDLHYG